MPKPFRQLKSSLLLGNFDTGLQYLGTGPEYEIARFHVTNSSCKTRFYVVKILTRPPISAHLTDGISRSLWPVLTAGTYPMLT